MEIRGKIERKKGEELNSPIIKGRTEEAIGNGSTKMKNERNFFFGNQNEGN